jgi:hypothetical protein
LPFFVPIRFRIFCVAARVYVCLGNEHGEARIVTQMESRGVGRWELTLRVPPGTYLYHYFADHGSVTTYVSPRDVDDMPTRMEGISAVLVVPESRCGSGAETRAAGIPFLPCARSVDSGLKNLLM